MESGRVVNKVMGKGACQPGEMRRLTKREVDGRPR